MCSYSILLPQEEVRSVPTLGHCVLLRGGVMSRSSWSPCGPHGGGGGDQCAPTLGGGRALPEAACYVTRGVSERVEADVSEVTTSEV